MEYNKFKLFINGEWSDSKDNNKTIKRYHPASRECVSEYINGTCKDVDYACDIALKTLKAGLWANLTRDQKAAKLLKVANGIEKKIKKLSLIESLETGKSSSDALNDIRDGIKHWEYASAIVRVEYGDYINNLSDNKSAYTLYTPVGVVALITPWNFPFIVMCERLPYMLAAGCCVVAKPSEYACGTNLIMGEILRDAGIPAGVYNVVSGDGTTGKHLVANNKVSMVSFTGSTHNGSLVMREASKSLKKVSLELGGKSPIIIFSDCDVEMAVEAVINGFTHNAGQCCIATSRLLIDKEISTKFVEKTIQKLDNNEFSQSIATNAQFTKIKSHIINAFKASGLRITGGEINENTQHISPAIIESENTDYNIYNEEIFGPVLAVKTFLDEEEAINLANDTQYGLAASVWTTDLNKANRVVRQVNAGRFWINTIQVNFPELPVGGTGISGIGRESGVQGILAYSEIKSVIFDEKSKIEL